MKPILFTYAYIVAVSSIAAALYFSFNKENQRERTEAKHLAHVIHLDTLAAYNIHMALRNVDYAAHASDTTRRNICEKLRTRYEQQGLHCIESVVWISKP